MAGHHRPDVSGAKGFWLEQLAKLGDVYLVAERAHNLSQGDGA